MDVHIGLLLGWLGQWLGGVDYVRNLVLAVGNLPEEERRGVRISLIYDSPPDAAFLQELAPHVHSTISRADAPRRTLARRIVWHFRRHLAGQSKPQLGALLSAHGIDFAYPFDGRPGRGGGFRSAAWIPDFQHEHLPHFFTPEEVRQRARMAATVAEVAPRVVLSSEAAAEDFRRIHPAHAAKALVMPFAVWPNPRWTEGNPAGVQAAYSLPDRFFLVCNQFWRHKNHLLVLEALRRLRERGECPALVCTGPLYDYRHPTFVDEVLQTIHRSGLAGHVRILGVVPRADQIQLMRRSLAVVQPSLFEGWSTVVEFAKSLGRPVILSDLDVHREQSPDGPFFARESPDALAELLTDAWRTLPSGPDLAREADARRAAVERSHVFARAFLALARSDS